MQAELQAELKMTIEGRHRGHPAAATRWSVDVPAVGSLLLVLFVSLAFPRLIDSTGVQWAPWVVALLFFGLPHGGIDHRIPALMVGGWQRRETVIFVIAYLLAIGLFLGLWGVSPDLGLSLFFLVSLLHFGQGDVYWSRSYGLLAETGAGAGGGRFGGLSRAAYKVLMLLTRGSLPVLLPWLAHPGEFQQITRELGGFLPGLRLDGWDGNGWVREWLLLAILLLSVLQMACGLLLVIIRRGRTGGRQVLMASIVEIAETALLIIVFYLTPPIPAVGIYFLCWHSVRHIFRLMEMAEPMSRHLGRGDYWRAVGSLHWQAMPMTLGAILILSLILVLTMLAGIDVGRLVVPAFLFVSAVTFPHFLVVVWMDCRLTIPGAGRQPN